MNPISKAISDLKFKIPREILKSAFTTRDTYSGLNLRTPVSIEWIIREEVLEARVLEDINLVSGQEATIPLGNIVPEYPEINKTVWRIPLKLTNNKKITKVYSLIMGGTGVGANSNMYENVGGGLVDATKGLLSTNTNIPNISNADINLISENTVLAIGRFVPTPALFLRCDLEHDSDLNNLVAAAYHKFSKLVEYAVKSYIYNTLIIKIDKAALMGGQELGSFLNIVESYSDSEELYQEYLNDVWRPTALLADPQAKRRHLKMIMGRT